MNVFQKILVAEDELTNSILIKRLLTKAGYSVVVSQNGVEALKHLEKESFDALLTDWMMPNMDGIELIRRVRDEITPLPLIIMVTALVSEGAKSYALESGADDYIAKPINVDELLSIVKDGLDKKQQAAPKKAKSLVQHEVDVQPPFIGVGICTSTGGPPTLIEIIKDIDKNTRAAFYIVQHGPAWMLETFSQRLQRDTKLNVYLGTNGMVTKPGNIYIAPGDKHMRVEKGTMRILLDNGPKENFVRPAGDPLFRSIADAFGKFSIGVVLTGLGRDAAQGATQISSRNGVLLIQDPDTAVAPSMPRTTINTGIKHKVVPLPEMAKTLSATIFPMSASLKKLNAK